MIGVGFKNFLQWNADFLDLQGKQRLAKDINSST